MKPNPVHGMTWVPNELDALVGSPEDVITALCHYPLKEISAEYLRKALDRQDVRDKCVERGVWLYPESWKHAALVANWIPVTTAPRLDKDGRRLIGWRKKRGRRV